MLKSKETAFLSEFPSVTPARWKQRIIREMKDKPFDDLIWRTDEGFDIQPFYTREDMTRIKIAAPLKQTAGWEIRQDIIANDFRESNEAARKALEQGAESIGFRLSKVDLTKRQLQKLLAGIDLTKHPVHFSGVRMKSLQALVAAIDSDTSGSVEITDLSLNAIPVIAAISQKFPSFGFITVKAPSAGAYGNKRVISGQLAEMLNRGSAILKVSLDAEIPLEKILPAIRFSVSLAGDYFMEAAKLRALRILWTEQANRFGITKEVPVFIHAENTLLKPLKGEEHYNILRAATIAMSAVIGGCDSLSLHPSLIPGKSRLFSERIYRNIQLLLKYESHFDKLNDPARGSYYVEVLTHQLADQFRKLNP